MKTLEGGDCLQSLAQWDSDFSWDFYETVNNGKLYYLSGEKAH